MTAGAFDRLLYTDCRAGTGRGALVCVHERVDLRRGIGHQPRS